MSNLIRKTIIEAKIDALERVQAFIALEIEAWKKILKESEAESTAQESEEDKS